MKPHSTHVENRMGLRASWPAASNAGAKSDPLSPRDKSRIWHQKDSAAEDDSGKKGAQQNSIAAKRVLYWTENDHASTFIRHRTTAASDPLLSFNLDRVLTCPCTIT